jgi:predicted AlkP superfamily phosphohydrolase/phosphomutase
MIGGVAIPRGAPFVTPEAWAQELERQAPFPINGMEWLRSREEPEALVREAKRIVEDRTASFEFMLEGSWDVAVCVFVAPDRLQHPFGAYLLPSHPRHAELTDTELAGELRAVYGLVDEALGRLRRAAGSDALTIVMSDHGFRQIERVLNLGRLLRAVGFSSAGSRAEMARSLRGWAPTRAIARTRLGYRLKQRVRAPSTLDWAKTIAYHAGTGGAVSINLRGREIHGVVDPADYERVRAEVVEALLSYVDPTSGQRPIRAVTRREDLPTGEHVDTAPDLMARPAAGWSFGNVGEVAVASEWPTGDHRQQGILAVSSADRRDLGAPSIVDLAPTVLASQGLAVPGIDGRVIPGVVADDVVLDEQRGVEGVFVASAAGEVSDDEQDEISQHLRDLWYIE